MRYLFLLLPIFLYSDTLKELLDFATKKSDIVLTKTYIQKSKSKDVESKDSAYYPTIDIGSFYQTTNEKSLMQSGDVYSGYAKLSYEIYDGGRKTSLLNQSKHLYQASRYNLEDTKKGLKLEIVKFFYSIKSLKSSLASREEALESLKQQLKRVKRFYIAKVATKDDVDRLQAALDTNIYEMESLKLQILSLKKMLELKVGKPIQSLEISKFQNFMVEDFELTDNIKSLISQKDALVSGANSVDSIYFPQIKLEDTYSLYGYNRVDDLHPKGVDTENKLLVSLNMRLFDMGHITKAKEAIIINSQAINSQVAYFKKFQKMEYDVAMSRIKTAKIKIKSASSALLSATSAFNTITKKYNARIVDNVVYLDALASKTAAKAQYEKSLNDLEVAYAIYYYYAGKNIEEFLE
jgi:outer membrane protein TolC